MISADYAEPRQEATEGAIAINPQLADMQAQWMERLDKAEKAATEYRDEVKRSLKWLRLDKDGRKSRAGGKLNIAFANYEVMRSTVYSRPPQVVVQPRFGGGPLRQQLLAVSEVMERAVASEAERQGLHQSLKLARDELLKAQRGVIWVRYDADLVEQEPGEPQEMETANPAQEASENEPEQAKALKMKVGERVAYDVITWRNFIHGPGKCWKEVPWVARCEDMTAEAIRDKFDLDKTAQANLGLEFSEDEGTKDGTPKTTEGKTCKVYEVWCKSSRKVYFVARGARQLIEAPSEPLINVEGFFPCPEPAMSVTQDGEVRPIPDVVMIEDQLLAIDKLTKRIMSLEDALKVRGFYPKGATDTTAADAIEDAVKSNDDRQVLIPVPSFAAGNGSKLDIVWLPLDVVVQAITTLKSQRQEAIELVYQVTGISDVMRGASEASETLGAQQIKDRWGGVRVRDKQEEMRRLARDVLRITAEIICEEFDPETIARSAVYGFDMQMMQIMRDDKTRSLVIDVETDSTIQADEQEDKQRATELATTVGTILTQGVQIAAAAPELIPLIGATLKHVVQRHRAGREMESAIEQAVQMLTQKASQPPQPPQPSPDEIKAESNEKIAMVKARVEMRGQDIDAELKARDQSMQVPMMAPGMMAS